MLCGVISPQNAKTVKTSLPISVNSLINTLNLPNIDSITSEELKEGLQFIYNFDSEQCHRYSSWHYLFEIEVVGIISFYNRKNQIIFTTLIFTTLKDLANEPSLLIYPKECSPTDNNATPIQEVDLAPSANAPEYLHEIYRFVQADERRWLAPEYLRRFCQKQPFEPYVQDAEKICKWVKLTEANKPDYADKEQWQVKVDLLKALAFVLVPRSEALEEIGLPDGQRVPALLFAELLENGTEDKKILE